jgi:ABC-2 type transport system ATP-binding protein
VETVIEVRDLVKKYKKSDVNAVDGVSFTVEQGQFFTFLGPNGAGKTTTISILTTTLSKTSGEVKIIGKDIDKEPSAIRKNLGIIFQKPSLDLNLTAEENIRFHAVLYAIYPFRPSFKLMPDSYKDKVHELASLLAIDKEIFKPVKTFSGGMKRKLEIIRSLMHEPKILFLDEPTTGLDPVSRANLWEYLQEVRRKNNTTIFLTTHYLDEAEEADMVCVINSGVLKLQGTPKEIKQSLVKPHLIFEVHHNDSESLENELRALGLVYTKKDCSDTCIYTIEFGNKRGHEIIKSIETPIHRIDINNPTLEEAYVKLVGDAGLGKVSDSNSEPQGRRYGHR